MKVFTQKEFDAIPRDDRGVKHCPTGDYTQVNSFGLCCSFGEGCSFGERCSFGESCSFGDICSFGERCSFGGGCSFGNGCVWQYFPMLIDFADLGELSDRLTYELMHRDAESHPCPQAFDAWAKGGDCPYGGAYTNIERRHLFRERKDYWNCRFKRMTTYELIVAVASEKGWKIKASEVE